MIVGDGEVLDVLLHDSDENYPQTAKGNFKKKMILNEPGFDKEFFRSRNAAHRHLN